MHGFGEGAPADLAAKYTELLKSHPSIDNSGANLTKPKPDPKPNPNPNPKP